MVNADWNDTIAAGGGWVGVGFHGTDTGQDPAPTALLLNETVCANIWQGSDVVDRTGERP